MLDINKFKSESDGKYHIKIPSFPSYYLPSSQKVFKLFKLPDNLIKFIPLLEEESGAKLDVGRSTLAKLHTDGVGNSSFKKIIDFIGQNTCKDFVNSFNALELELNEKDLVNSNAYSWAGFYQKTP